MNEMTMNSACMYDEVAEIRNLNRVEGFDPRKYMRLIQNEGQAGKYYLDVAYRKLWFRLRYPEGKIVKKILKLTEQVAIVEARVYLNRNDHEDNFISNALAQKYMTADGQFGNKFVELAETAAVGRALSDAGFGLQFADREGDMDPEVTEAPFDAQMVAGMGGMLPEGTYMDSALQEDAAGNGEILQEETFPGQYGIEEYIPMPEEVGQAMGMPPAMQQAGAAPAASGQAAQGTAPAAARQAAQGTAPAAAQTQQPSQGMTPAMQNNQAAQTPAQGGPAAQNANRPAAQKAGNTTGRNTASAKGGNAQAAGGIRRDMPVEQIYPMLNRDSAAAVVIPMGYNKGKTLGQVAVEKPANLQWYVDSYGGPDNLLRAAAKFLIDAALGQAG
ncbi:MAG: hypothetical protein K2K90_15400 [Lachnospiraceae bacterium]|nr:hypothetical protein [Lachnospiraceae bacterium]